MLCRQIRLTACRQGVICTQNPFLHLSGRAGVSEVEKRHDRRSWFLSGMTFVASTSASSVAGRGFEADRGMSAELLTVSEESFVASLLSFLLPPSSKNIVGSSTSFRFLDVLFAARPPAVF